MNRGIRPDDKYKSEPSSQSQPKDIRKTLNVIIFLQIIILFTLFARTPGKQANKLTQNVDYDKIEYLIKENTISHNKIDEIIQGKLERLDVCNKNESYVDQGEQDNRDEQGEQENQNKQEDKLLEINNNMRDNKDDRSVGDKVGEATDYLGQQFKKIIKIANEKLNQ